MAQPSPAGTFADVRYYVMFMGYAHSGHSVVGAILDAHPNMIVANELHALPKFAEYDYDTERVYELILENSREMARDVARTNTGYNYNIPGLHQGTFERLEVIGDKKGGASAVYHSRNPEVFDRVSDVLDGALKLVHVVRNPYDNISAYAYRLSRDVDVELVRDFFGRADAVLDCRAKLLPEQFRTLHYEELLADSRTEIAGLCAFLGQRASDAYLDGCAKVLYGLPNERRQRTPWGDSEKQLVAGTIAREPYSEFFGRYTFE